ncbi:hypothetical protein HanHA300_Chr04g0148061 [Helianthus annuus]|nr:hypothetical protein HanHA300_Chr04g0148061 [Helianthus annuus]KAJ0598042.1 hypothetical protein HanHA89_Chr04g0161421 [Helianthus annuus]KAJ0758672.1 hypothetical protein HanLR1_Chr04g0153001 [Helianthus annuus]
MFYNFYFCSKHWSLIIVCPDFKFGNIVDSITKGRPIKITSSSRSLKKFLRLILSGTWHRYVNTLFV